MIDITTIKEAHLPFINSEAIAPKISKQASALLWLTIITVILIFCVWGYVAHRENHKTKQL